MVVRPIFLPPPPPKIIPKNNIDRIAELRAQAQKLREQIRLAQKMGEAEEATKLQKELSAVQGKLDNPNFMSRAAPEVVEKSTADAANLRQRIEKLTARQTLLS